MTPPTIIVIVNRSKDTRITNALIPIVRALGKQLADDVAPTWGRMVPSLMVTDTPSSAASQIVILDDADQADVLGYHSETPEGIPYGRVFINPILENRGTIHSSETSVSVTLSHELLEIVGDPSVNYWADAEDGYSYALELADAVEGDSYLIGDVHVSNFVLPAFFDPRAEVGSRFDHMGKLGRPFTTTRGGYQIRRRITGHLDYVYGDSFPEWKQAMKMHPAARSRRRYVETAIARDFGRAPPDTAPEMPETREV